MTASPQALDNPEGPRLSRVRPLLVLQPYQLQEAVDYLLQFPRFVIDLETTWGKTAHTNDVFWVGLAGPGRVYLIPCGHPKGRLLEAAHYEQHLPPENERKVLKNGELSQAKKKYLIPARFGPPPAQMYPGQVFSLLEPLLFSDRIKAGHNVKFDLLSAAKYYNGRIPPGPYDDSMLVTHVLDENRLQYDLKNTVMDWLRIPSAERKLFYPNLGRQGVENFSIDEAARYLAKDVRYSWLYLWNQRPRIARQRLDAAYDLEMSVYPVLMRMEQAGFPVNTAQLDLVGKELSQQIADTASAIWLLAGRRFDLTNVGMKRDALFLPKKEGGQGLKPLSFTEKTKVPQLNKATLEYYSETNAMASLMLEWAALEKLNGTFVVGLNNHLINGRIHTNFNQHGTVTSRLSAHEPNLQQIPARGRGTIIRELFVAGPGKMLVVADYDQIELRCAAFLSEDPDMIQVFLEGQDIHAAAAAAMYQVPIEDVTPLQRQAGKGQNFLTLYGGGAGKLARVAGVSVQEAQAFIDRYYRQFKGLKSWKDVIVKEARSRGDRSEPFRKPPYVMIPPTRRRRRLPDLYSPYEYDRYRAERQAVNAVVQGFASNIMKLALIDLDLPTQKVGATMLCTVHDEIITQCDVDTVEEVKDIVTAIMSGVSFDGKPILGTVPLQVKASAGYTWAEAKE